MGTVFLAPLYRSTGWVVNNVTIGLNGNAVRVHLVPDGRSKGLRCPTCPHRMGKMRERKQSVLDLPSWIASVFDLVFATDEGRCGHCAIINTFRPTGVSANAQATDRSNGM